MSEHRRVRRCAIVMIEPRERLRLDVGGLLSGENALAADIVVVALAPHLGVEIEIAKDERDALLSLGETPWVPIETLADTIPSATLERLLEKGLVIGDGPEHGHLRSRDDAVRAKHWRPLSAVAHYFSRWKDSGENEDARFTRHRPIADLVDECGLPPPHLTERVPSTERRRFSPPRESALDDLFRRRVTCRNFDTAAMLPERDLGDVLQRVLGCLAIVEVMPGVNGLKKSYPSGGGLHPLEPYLLIQRVEGVPTGLYHYHAGEHALEPLSLLSDEEAERHAKIIVAGQGFFADAPVHIVLAARFERTFWKYRNHPKAYRAILLEAGHVSQNLYLATTEAGLGAYVTAAINEIDIERMFGLDALEQSPVVVCGFGPRASRRVMLEFDPLGTVWPDAPVEGSVTTPDTALPHPPSA